MLVVMDRALVLRIAYLVVKIVVFVPLLVRHFLLYNLILFYFIFYIL